jgi:hypothetical protein
MNRSMSGFQALSPRSNNYTFQDCDQEQIPFFNAPPSTYAGYFDGESVSANGLEPLNQILSPSTENNTKANTLDQSYRSNINFDIRSNSSQALLTFAGAQQSASRYDDGIPRGSENNSQHPGLSPQDREAQRGTYTYPQQPHSSPYNTHHRSHSAFSQRSMTTPMQNPQNPSAEQPEISSNQFTPYRGLFNNSTKAKNHRHLVTRFGRQPYVSPANDPSIEEIEKDRQYHVGRIYCAMTRGDRAQDNPGSIAVKRWVHPGAHYKSDLVEAFAHKVFDCLLAQVKAGFRGWHHNDYVEDDRKGEKEDRDVDCHGRLDNIIDALEREKTICEDVVTSASQIRMFVNAPIAYAMRKYQNRVGNSKRGRTKETTDSNSRLTKVRRTGGRRARARSGTAPEAPASRDTSPQFQILDNAAAPYYLTPASQITSSSPVPAQLSRLPLHRAAVSASLMTTHGHNANAVSPSVMCTSVMKSPYISRAVMSPPCRPASQYHTQGSTVVAPTQASPSFPSSPLSYNHHSAPPSTDNMRYEGLMSTPEIWPKPQSFDEPLCATMDPSLPASDFLFADSPWSNHLAAPQTESSTDQYHHDSVVGGVSLADLERRVPQHAEPNSNEFPNFETLWNNQPGVQQFSFQPRDGDQSQG